MENNDTKHYEYINSFVAIWENARDMPDKLRLAFYDAYFAYAHTCQEPDFSAFDNELELKYLNSNFGFARKYLDGSHERYEKRRPGAPLGNKNAAKDKGERQLAAEKKQVDDDMPADDAIAPRPKTKMATPPPQPPTMSLPPEPPKPRTEEPPTIQAVMEYADNNNIDADAARDFWLNYQKKNWISKGEPIQNWRELLVKWVDCYE